MTIAEIVGLVVKLSVALMVFGISLRAGLRGAALRNVAPGLLVRSLVAMYVVMPTIAVTTALTFDLRRELEVAIVVLALSPVPPILPRRQLAAGGSDDFVLSLLVVASMAAAVVVPIGVTVVGWIVGRDLAVPVGPTFVTVASSVLVPVACGIGVARLAPRFAERAAGPVTGVAGVLLLLAVVAVLFRFGDRLVALWGDFTLVTIVLYTLAGVAVGHLAGGPDPEHRSTLALATALRHPGVALGILEGVAPDDPGPMASVLLYVLVAALVVTPYVVWSKRSRAAEP